MPAELDVCGTTRDGLIMAVRHRQRPVVGLQFHPESILTQHGYRLLANFLQLASWRSRHSCPTWTMSATVSTAATDAAAVPGDVLKGASSAFAGTSRRWSRSRH